MALLTELSQSLIPAKTALDRIRRVLPGCQSRRPAEPTEAANRCNLRHITPKTLQEALYVGFSQIGRPLQAGSLLARRQQPKTCQRRPSASPSWGKSTVNPFLGRTLSTTEPTSTSRSCSLTTGPVQQGSVPNGHAGAHIASARQPRSPSARCLNIILARFSKGSKKADRKKGLLMLSPGSQNVL